MAPREKGRSRRGSDEEFVLFIQGVSRSLFRDQESWLLKRTDPSSLSLARTQGPRSTDSPAHPTSRGIRRPSWVSDGIGADHREEQRGGMADVS